MDGESVGDKGEGGGGGGGGGEFMGKSKGEEWKGRRRGGLKRRWRGGLLEVTEVEAWRRPTH